MTAVAFVQGDWCEHCMELPSGSLTFFDGGTYWCIACAFADGVLDEAEADALWDREDAERTRLIDEI